MKNIRDEAFEAINELLDCISWLGGDAHEVEAAEKMCEGARAFLEKYKTEEEKETEYRFDNAIKMKAWEMLFVCRDDESKYVVSDSKRHAKNILNTALRNVKCMANYWDIERGKVKKFKWDGRDVVCI